MKTYTLRTWTVASVAALLVSAAANTSADEAGSKQAATTARHEKHYTGTIVFVDHSAQMMRVKDVLGLFHKTFSLADNCACSFIDKGAGTAADLRAGQKVDVGYQDAHGVLVADRVTQQPMRFTGVVQAVDPQQHTLIVRERMLDKVFTIPSDCSFVLHDNKSGTLANVKVGERITVTFETPAGVVTARQIAQPSDTFTGELIAIDLAERTLKAKTLLGTKQFELAKDCTLIIDGKPSHELRDLRPGDKLTISYDDVNGVYIANCIADGGVSLGEKNAQTSVLQYSSGTVTDQ
jgi:hypothetical protein